MRLDWRPSAAFFLAGLIIGSLSGSWAQRRAAYSFWTSKDPSRSLARLDKRLALDGNQQKAVLTALEKRRARMETFRKDALSSFMAIRSDTRTEIRQVLSPEQQRKFDELGARFEAKHKAFFQQFGR